jgi:hypothetical protein
MARNFHSAACISVTAKALRRGGEGGGDGMAKKNNAQAASFWRTWQIERQLYRRYRQVKVTLILSAGENQALASKTSYQCSRCVTYMYDRKTAYMQTGLRGRGERQRGGNCSCGSVTACASGDATTERQQYARRAAGRRRRPA